MREVMNTTAVQPHTLTSKSTLPHPAPAPSESPSPAPPAITPFSSLDLLEATGEGGLPGLLRLLHNARQRASHLLSRPMQELLAALEQYLLQPRHLADASRLQHHLLNSGLFLDAMLESGQPPALLHGDMKALLNKALQQLLPHQVLTEKSGGTSFEYQPELTAQLLLVNIQKHLRKDLQEGQKALLGKLLQSGPLLSEYQQNAETPGQSPVTYRHLATWLGHAVEEALCHIVQQQLRSFSDENQQYWRLSLYVELADELVTVPVEIQHGTAEAEPWLLGFSVKLASGNTIKVSMQIESSNVLVHFEADDILTQHQLSHRQAALRQAFSARGMTLQTVTTALLDKNHGYY